MTNSADYDRLAVPSWIRPAITELLAKAWDEGVRFAWDDPEPHDLQYNPYRVTEHVMASAEGDPS